MGVIKKRKYTYVWEECDCCGHKKRVRKYAYRRAKYEIVRTRDIGPILTALDIDKYPLTRLMAIRKSMVSVKSTKHGKVDIITHPLLEGKWKD